MEKPFKAVRLALGLIIVLFTNACGFKPMYGEHAANGNGLAQVLANIEIDQIRSASGRQERLSQLIENNLSDRISPVGANGPTKFILNATYEVEERGYGIREDESVTLQNLRLSVGFALIDVGSDEAVMDGTARAIVTYDLVQSDFSNLQARQTSLERLSEEVANQIITRIGTYLSNNPEMTESD